MAAVPCGLTNTHTGRLTAGRTAASVCSEAVCHKCIAVCHSEETYVDAVVACRRRRTFLVSVVVVVAASSADSARLG